MSNSKLFFGILLIIFAYYVSYYFYLGVLNPIPALGDSWDYHIPISHTILNGTFLHPKDFLLPQWYYPGSSEVFISLFSIFRIPLTFSNILATIVLVISLYKLGLVFKLEKYYSLVFSLSFSSLTVITRWMNSISIDVWISVFFVTTIIILEKIKKTNQQFFLLGLSSGMMIGSKYTGVIFLTLLFIFYFQKIRKNINFQRFIFFIIPFFLTGMFWYARNLAYVSNPVYPLKILGMNGIELFQNYVWQISISYPMDMFNAFFSEYKIWILLPPVTLSLLIINLKIKILNKNMIKLFLLGLILFILYFINPTSKEPWIMVSSLRYSYPAFIVLMLGTFMYIQKIKKENYLFLLVTATSINSLITIYYPKLILIYLPISIAVFACVDDESKIKKRIMKKLKFLPKL